MKVIGIESSCDETAASVVEDGRVLSDVIASQVEEHRPYGGVVPEIASRQHLRHIAPVIRKALNEAGVGLADLDGIAATAGPGLVGALLVGLQTAKSLAVGCDLPFIGVNHLSGHLLSVRIPDENSPRPDFPYMALLASGGHTGVYIVESETDISCLGSTRDDAAGEAFDKVAKLLGLGYPGGPIIDRLAKEEGPEETFPQALRQRRSYEFSFSGVKTSVAQHVAKLGSKPNEEQVASIARGFQRAVIEVLIRKVTLAARQRQISRVVLSGGVAANRGLREHAAEVCADLDLDLYVPSVKRCTDNGSMIAYVGYLALEEGRQSELNLAPKANWPIGTVF
ncbi:MAG: tRNA (adenosine(37)-N6)-threonylcarbamoyltransferase complex transferase subunit TsaD [Proteobacteria bacterium]|nr:tRNA (adenosine(37)-N6)-threonylcarbamoyltransferase complex transferase subunit TsaD [Pseudomonadota bacterium]